MDGYMGDLGRRAVACKGWRWLPGMATETGHRVLFVGTEIEPADKVMSWKRGTLSPSFLDRSQRIPDLTDPATMGCLLALVREAWSNPDLQFRAATSPPDMGGGKRWLVCGSRWAFMGSKTEAGAMVRALESKGKR